MGLIEIIIIVFVVVGIVVFVSKSGTPQTPLTEDLIDWDAISHHTVQDAIQSNKKINAIKAYRELTSQGLKEAKFAVEYAIKHPDTPLKHRKHRLAENSSDGGLRDLIREGKIEEAIETYQKFAGVDQFSAQDAIRQLQAELEEQTSRMNGHKG
jgi:hypothetical protein